MMRRISKRHILGGLLSFSTLALVASVTYAGGFQKITATQKVITVRPEAAILYVNYDQMLETADAIFIGRPVTSLGESKGNIKYFPNSSDVRDFYTLRGVEVGKVIKNNGLADIQKGNIVNVLETAVLYDKGGQKYRLISEGYEELLSKDKYIFFIDRTADGEYILFNGRLSKYSLDRTEKDEDSKKVEWKEKVKQQFKSAIAE